MQEQEQRPGRQGLEAGAEWRLRAVLQELEKLPGRQGSRQVPSDRWDGRLRAQGVTNLMGGRQGQRTGAEVVCKVLGR